MKSIFITGLYRSGTTLLEKVLQNHQNVFIASQPLPELLLRLKADFLLSKGIEADYPFDHMFCEERYKIYDFLEYLVKKEIDEETLKDIFEEQRGTKSMLTPEFYFFNIDQLIRPGTFYHVYRQVVNFLPKIYRKRNPIYTGSKEVIGEEFIPFLANKGNKALLIIRNPKDVLSSVMFGRGQQYMGDVRPYIHTLRMWRKSVAYAIASANNPDLMVIRYEDLLFQRDLLLDKITDFLEIPPFEQGQLVYGILDQNRMMWKGNSSFGTTGTFSKDSIDVHKSFLTTEFQQYVEAFCYPEMRYMNYSTSYIDNNLTKTLSSPPPEPKPVTHKSFPPDLSTRISETEVELERLQYLWKDDLDDATAKKYFLFLSTYKKLKSLV